ncbi:hypothetical protein HPB49_008010 [Dermacentor silvarum]|uniref:Uncharacterized protein n=1 Tax=Dermacentor silvarum TaxID=543639 RepID=A0ACB8DX43_DERSI|nr:hypothetical protein HPB49_008010 [Dermacentor silvarum]
MWQLSAEVRERRWSVWIEQLQMGALDSRQRQPSAIAMAIKHSDSAGHSALVISDSQAARMMHMQGRLPRIALRIISDAIQEQHAIIWCPGHEGIPGNERAHSLARELTNRAGNHSLVKIAQLRPETSSSTNVAQESALPPPPRISNWGYKKPAHTEEYKHTRTPT